MELGDWKSKDRTGCLAAISIAFVFLMVALQVGVVGFVLWAIYKLLQHFGII